MNFSPPAGRFGTADGDEVNFAGRYYQITGGRLPTPFSMNGVRRPEIYLGGKSEESAALAIRHADCLWRFAEPPESLADKIAPVIQAGTEVGLLVSLIARPTRSEAVRAASDLIGQFGERARDAQRSFERHTDAAAFESTYALARKCATDWATDTLWTGSRPRSRRSGDCLGGIRRTKSLPRCWNTRRSASRQILSLPAGPEPRRWRVFGVGK